MSQPQANEKPKAKSKRQRKKAKAKAKDESMQVRTHQEQYRGPQPRTESGRRWLAAYLHPPHSAGQKSVDGIPDLSTQSSVVLDWENKLKIGPPPGLAEGDQWSMLVVALPNPQVPAWVLRWAGDTPPAVLTADNYVRLTNTSFLFGTDAGNWANAAVLCRPVCHSVTTELVASSLYDQGQLAGAKSTYRTVHQPADQAGAFESVDLDFGELPTEQGQILQMSAKAGDFQAKEGGFMVENYVDPAMQYVSSGPVKQNLRFYLRGSAVEFDLFGGPGAGAPEAGAPSYQGMSTGYQLYTSLLPQASVSVKVCHQWEVTVSPRSPWIPFVTPGPTPDMGALELGQVMMHQLPDLQVAAANSFGSFLSGAWNKIKAAAPIAKAIWGLAGPAVKGVVGNLPGGATITKGIDIAEKLLGAAR